MAERNDGEGEVYWVAVGWKDPDPLPGVGDTTIAFCPFCGVKLPVQGAEAEGPAS